MFFPLQARMPQVRFDVTILNTDDGTNRFELNVGGGPSLVWAHTEPRAHPVEWPDPKPGPATATWVDKAGRRPYVRTDGPWAWFRLLQRGSFKPEASQRYMLRLADQGHWVEIRVSASSINNPFGDLNQLKGFSCR
jgi:type VI secretion system protein ImpL